MISTINIYSFKKQLLHTEKNQSLCWGLCYMVSSKEPSVPLDTIQNACEQLFK